MGRSIDKKGESDMKKTECGFEVASIRDIVEAFHPKTISIENDDYRGCPPADWETLCRWYRGTDILRTSVSKIVIDDVTNHINVWL